MNQELTMVEIQVSKDIEILKKVFLYNAELLNTNEDRSIFTYQCEAYGIDHKRISFLKKNGFSITSIYPINANVPMLEVFLKRRIKGGLEN